MSSRHWVMPLSCLLAAGVSGAAINVEIRRDIEYARAGNAGLALDAGIPQTAEPCPAVIVVHGGGWVRGDRATDVAPLLQPLSDAGFAWFSISYRLMNDVTQFGAGVEDVEAAIRFVKTHAAEYRKQMGSVTALPGATELLASLTGAGRRMMPRSRW